MDFCFLTCQIWQFLQSFQILFPTEVSDLGKAISTTYPQVHTESFVLTWDCSTSEIFKFLFPILIIRLLFPPISFTYCIYTNFCLFKKKKKKTEIFRDSLVSLVFLSYLEDPSSIYFLPYPFEIHDPSPEALVGQCP